MNEKSGDVVSRVVKINTTFDAPSGVCYRAKQSVCYSLTDEAGNPSGKYIEITPNHLFIRSKKGSAEADHILLECGGFILDCSQEHLASFFTDVTAEEYEKNMPPPFRPLEPIFPLLQQEE